MSEAASADDLAALFAPVKPTVNVSTEPPAKPIEQVDLCEAATADDIAALFATVKSAVNPAPGQSAEIQSTHSSLTASAVSSAIAVSSTSQEPSLPTGEELNEVASLDDIESLFATIKK